MAHILPFRSSAAQGDPERGPNDEPVRPAGAQIIIFPGVRRERHVEPAPKSPKRREKGRPKRDRLELPD